MRGRILFFLLSCISSLCQATVLQSVVVKEDRGNISVFCTLSSVPSYRAFLLSAPTRAVVDFEQSTTRINTAQVAMPHDIIDRLRSGHPDPHTLRLVFDLKHASDIKIVRWKTGIAGTQGLRIDLIPRGRPLVKQPIVQPTAPPSPHPQTAYNPVPHPYQPSATLLKQHPVQEHPLPHRAVAVTPVAPPPAPVVAPPPVVKPQEIARQPIAIHHAPPRSLRDVLVVIDAGHGGKDPGAAGPRRNVEKRVVLNIALKLKRLIDKQPGMRAILTRRGDYYVGLRERLNIARKANADIFVSIHADAFNNRNSNGASVYALSPSGATSEAARWLAEKENYSELGGVDLSGLDDRNGMIRTVLLDLSQTATINAGLQIGDRILQNLNQMTTLHHNKVEQARFVVLKSPDIPSVLVETGFISNPREEFNLTSPAYQDRLSYAIFQGVKRYFWDSPPHGTRIEAMLGGSNYLLQTHTAQKPIVKSRRKTA